MKFVFSNSLGCLNTDTGVFLKWNTTSRVQFKVVSEQLMSAPGQLQHQLAAAMPILWHLCWIKRYETVIVCNRPREYQAVLLFPQICEKTSAGLLPCTREGRSFLVVVEFARKSMNMAENRKSVSIPKSWKWIPTIARRTANPRSMFSWASFFAEKPKH